MSTVLDRFIANNPLVGHGPRSHSTGIALPEPAQAARRPHARWDVDAPRVHLGHAGR